MQRVSHTNPVSENKKTHHREWFVPLYMDTFPYVNPETLEFVHCDAHYQYILLTYTDVLLTYSDALLTSLHHFPLLWVRQLRSGS